MARLIWLIQRVLCWFVWSWTRDVPSGSMLSNGVGAHMGHMEWALLSAVS